MKRILIMAVAVLAMIGVNSAQAETQWNVGAKGGLNISNLYGDDTPDTDSRTGFNGGVFLGAGVNETFSIQFELLYSQQGSAESFDSAGVSVETTIKLDYIHIPVLGVVTYPASETVDDIHSLGNPVEHAWHHWPGKV